MAGETEGFCARIIATALFDKILIGKLDMRSNFVTTQLRKCKHFFVFAAPKFGSFVESRYLCTIIYKCAIMTVREMKNDMVHMINQMDDSSEEKVKDMWLYVRQIVKPAKKEEVLTPDQKRRLELVDKLCGAFSACQTVDWKKDKEEYMLEKYGQ